MVNFNKLATIWKSRTQILEGVKNNVFKSKDVEEIASVRADICNSCPHLDSKGSSCLMSGTQPCCGKCGCSLKFKLRSLSSACGDEETPRWHALLSEEEEDALKEEINYQEPTQNVNSIYSGNTQVRKPGRE